jgi:hypothetical protein
MVSDPAFNGGRPFQSDECITVSAPPPEGAKRTIEHFMRWVYGVLPKDSIADPASAEDLANTPAMDNIRLKFKESNCLERKQWSDFQVGEFFGTHSLTGHTVGGFVATLTELGDGNMLVHARNTWGLESGTRIPGTGNRGNPSVQSLMSNPQYFISQWNFGAATPGVPKSILNNVSAGPLKTAQVHYLWVEASPCAQ